jgi:hypothetical protein
VTDLLSDRPVTRTPWRTALGFDTMTRADLALLCGMLALAVTIRQFHLYQPLVDHFSWREASTAMMSDNFRTGGWNIFFPEVNWTGPGPSYQGREFPLFSFLVAVMHALFGWHDWFGRLLAMMFGTVTIFSLHRLTALVWTERHAHAAAFCYALMPATVMIETSYLPDPAMLALVTLGIWVYLRYWITGERFLLVVAAISFTLGVLAKLPGLSAGLVIVFLAVLLAIRGEGLRAYHTAVAALAGLVVIVAWYAWAIYLGSNYPPYHVAGSGYIWDMGLDAFLAEAFYLLSLRNLSVWWFYGYPFIGLMALGLWKMPTDGTDGDAAIRFVPLLWLISGVLLYLVAAREITSNPWNLHILHIPVAMFSGHAVVWLIGQGGTVLVSIRLMLRIVLLAGAIIGLATVPLVRWMKDPQGEEARLLGQELERLMLPGDLVIAVAPEVGDPIAIYYSRGRGWVFPPGGGKYDWSMFGEDGPEAIAVFEELHDQGAAWFGVAKNARDRQDLLFVEHYVELLAYLDATAVKVVDTRDYFIYRLSEPLPR